MRRNLLKNIFLKFVAFEILIEIKFFYDYDYIQQNCALTAKHCQGIKEWLAVPMHV